MNSVSGFVLMTFANLWNAIKPPVDFLTAPKLKIVTSLKIPSAVLIERMAGNVWWTLVPQWGSEIRSRACLIYTRKWCLRLSECIHRHRGSNKDYLFMNKSFNYIISNCRLTVCQVLCFACSTWFISSSLSLHEGRGVTRCSSKGSEALSNKIINAKNFESRSF